jgi:hypothetical protein
MRGRRWTIGAVSAAVAACVVALGVLGLAFSAAAEGQTAEQGREIVGLRTENSQTFLLSNGQYRCDVFAGDVFYRNAEGFFAPIDSSLTDAGTASGYRYTTVANSWHASFADSLAGNSAVRIEKDEYSLAFGLVGASPGSTVARATALAGLQSETDKELAEDARAAVYRNVLTSTDIAYTVLNSALKETIILRDKKAPQTFTFLLTSKNLKPMTKDGITSFVDERGYPVFTMSSMYMKDANGKYSEAVTYTLEETSEGCAIEVLPDPSFLSAPDTVYPVVVDPTFDTTGSSVTFDSFVAQGYPSTNYGTDTKVRTGNYPGWGIRRAYIRFRLPSGYRYDGVSNATLKLRLSEKGSSALNLRAYAIDYSTANFWKSTTVNWNNKPTPDAAGSAIATVSSNWYLMNVTSAVKDVYHQYASNLGFCVRDDVEGSTSVYGVFYSSDSGTSYLPVLSITYTTTTSYEYWAGSWPVGVSDDLTMYIGGTADTLYGDELNGCWQRWNGINANLNVDGLYRSGTADSYSIRFLTDSNLSNDELGWTRFYDSNWNEVFPSLGAPTWSHVRIYLNPNASSVMYTASDDIQQEAIIHEVGHAMALAHVEGGLAGSSVCIMQQWAFYCYPYPTSHDQQTVNAKY